MGLLKAAAIGAIAAIALPYVTRDQPELFGGIFWWWTVSPIPGTFGLHFSIPVFFIITLFAWMFFSWSNR